MQEDHVIAIVMDFVGSTCQGHGENSQGRELKSGCQRAEPLSEPGSPDCQFGGDFMHQALKAGVLRGLGGNSLGKPLKKVSVRISNQTGKSES